MKTLLAAAFSFAILSTVLTSHASARPPTSQFASPTELTIFNQRTAFARQNGNPIYGNGVRERNGGVSVLWVTNNPGTAPYAATRVVNRASRVQSMNFQIVSDTAIPNANGQLICSGHILAKMNGTFIRGGRNMNIVVTLDRARGATVALNGQYDSLMIPPAFQ